MRIADSQWLRAVLPMQVVQVVFTRFFSFQASSLPTVIVYVMDTSRSMNPVTFMSNMLYACSILYKTKLPFIVVMNKVMQINSRVWPFPIEIQ
jgi:hypothetical protein